MHRLFNQNHNSNLVEGAHTVKFLYDLVGFHECKSTTETRFGLKESIELLSKRFKLGAHESANEFCKVCLVKVSARGTQDWINCFLTFGVDGFLSF